MAEITKLEHVQHSEIPGVTIYPMLDSLRAGEAQDVLVRAEPNARIPLHTHEVDATMVIIAGSGTVLSSDESLNGAHVQANDVVYFEKQIGHGFQASSEGLVFVSKNGGIVDSDEDAWDISFLE